MDSLPVNCYIECRDSCTNTSSIYLSSSSVSSLFLSTVKTPSRRKVNFLPRGLQKDVLLPAHTDT